MRANEIPRFWPLQARRFAPTRRARAAVRPGNTP
jgi:hypothetical protein